MRRWIVAWVVLVIMAIAFGTASATQPVPQDACEPNDTWEMPCPVAIDVPIVFTLSEGDRDVWSVYVPPSLTSLSVVMTGPDVPQIDVTARPSLSISDTTVTVRPVERAGSIARWTVVPSREGWYLIQATSLVSRPITATILFTPAWMPTATPASPAPAEATVGDQFENNYSPETAAPIAAGIWYDATYLCPSICPDGDHDMYILATKPGTMYAAVALAIGNGADPTLAVLEPDPTAVETWLPGWRVIAFSDDAHRTTLDAMVQWTATTPMALLVSVSSGRALTPERTNAPPTYRFIAGPRSLPIVDTAVRDVLRISPGAGASEADMLPFYRGPARVRVRTGWYDTLPPATPRRWYEPGERVTILDQRDGPWVLVRPDNSVLAGWMRADDLLPDTGTPSPSYPMRDTGVGGEPFVPAPGAPGGSAFPTGTPGGSPAPADTPGGSPAPADTPGGSPAPADTPGGSPAPADTPGGTSTGAEPKIVVTPMTPSNLSALEPRRIQVVICRDEACRYPMAGVPVLIVQPDLGRILADARTDATGSVVLDVQVPRPWVIAAVVPSFGILEILPQQPFEERGQQVRISIR